MGDASFSALVESWLEAVKPGLGVHASVIFKYGATSEDDMASLDKRDISALEELFAKAGVAPLQVRRIADRMPSMIDAIRTAMHTPAGKPAPAGAAATSSTAEDWRRRKRAQQEGTESDEDDDFVDDDSDFDEEEPGEDGGEEAGEDGGEEVEEDAVRRPQPANTTSRSRARKGGARRQAKGAAAAKGKAPIPSMFGRSSAPSGNFHGLGGQASAASASAGRANPFSNSGIGGRGPGDFCTKPCGISDKCECAVDAAKQCTGSARCAQELVVFNEGSVVALRTPSELMKQGGAFSKCAAATRTRAPLHSALMYS